MKKQFLNNLTIFYVLSLIALLGIVVSSIIMTNQNGMNQRLQGWVNLLWLPLPILIFIIDRIWLKKSGVKKTNKIQLYIVAAFVLLFVLNVMRLQVQI
ncbi:hypothetical protein H9X96_04000 [Pedobacter sp. N36a]|uniref:hypothetical protein n=1 Tax=Pedobacter sp. N36a TaxID=2767996 RepID=UPI001656B774|nr:hypothetical protein [Pedobacter sp. N36a]MBC8984933.1 hypothetical protein [Pedobacter sp. N36a]